MSIESPGVEPSVLDPEERLRLRMALGLEGASEEPARRARPKKPAAAPAPAPVDDVAFLLIDLERKIDKLLDSAVTIDQLSAQVLALTEQVKRLDRALIGLR